MPEMIIMLRRDPETGKQNIIVKLESDPDSLPFEHEQMHRRLVNKLVEGGMVKAEDLGEVTVERLEPNEEPPSVVSKEEPQRQSVSQGGS